MAIVEELGDIIKKHGARRLVVDPVFTLINTSYSSHFAPWEETGTVSRNVLILGATPETIRRVKDARQRLIAQSVRSRD